MVYTSGDIDVIEGLEAIRRRPTMYVGEPEGGRTLCSRLVESVVGNAASDTPSPRAVQLTLWAGEAASVAFDGEPLPIAPYCAGAADIPHPELYRMFMYVAAPATIRSLSFGAAIVNALSSRLVVSTVHDGLRYRAAFSRGALVSLLSKAATDLPHGTNCLTFTPDLEVVPGGMTFGEAQAITGRVGTSAPTVKVSAIDRSTEKPDWW